MILWRLGLEFSDRSGGQDMECTAINLNVALECAMVGVVSMVDASNLRFNILVIGVN